VLDCAEGSESGSSIALVRDDSIRSTVLEVRGRNVATTYLSCPAPHLASSLALELPFLGMLLKPVRRLALDAPAISRSRSRLTVVWLP